MKNFSKAAIALAAATSVAFAGTPAFAQTEAATTNGSVGNVQQNEPNYNGPLVGSLDETVGGAKEGDALYLGGVFAKIGHVLQAGTPINGEDLFGSSQSATQPLWAQIFKWGAVALVLGALASAASLFVR